jgi:hypothetical protein
MDALLLGCRDEDESIRLACAECIGAIGALDPGQLSWRELQSGKFDRSVLCYDWLFKLLIFTYPSAVSPFPKNNLL